MKRVIMISAFLVLQGCAQSGYKEFYRPFVDPKTIPELEVLGENEEPKMYVSGDFDFDIGVLRAKRYEVVGISSFNGGYEDTKKAVEQAKRIGATIVLVNSEYTDTQTSTSPLVLPSNQITYHSGSFYGGGVNGGYSGTSTTYGNTVVSFSKQQRRYDQTAIYLVKSNHKVRFGLKLADLTPQHRSEIGQNTGAFIDVVFEGTPAFYSNVMSGDILLAVDSIPVRDVEHALELMAQVPLDAETSTLTLFRDDYRQEIAVKF